jgi:pimeloyl-ACP methyl ester carboxylesterase
MMRCELENLTVYYEEYGEGRPLLALHGSACDHQLMVGIMEPVFAGRTGWRRIYPDLPGMGQTPGPAWLTTYDQVLDAVLTFIDALFPAQRFAVAGYSLGGLLARGVVRRRAAWLDGVLLTAPVVLAEPAVPPKTTLVADPTYVAELEAAGAPEWVIGLAVIQSRRLAELVKRDGLPGVQAADYAFLERLGSMAFSFDVDQLAAPFPGPTLILAGRQDFLTGYQDAWALLDNYPRATFAVMDRAGHALPYEQEALVTALTGEWLDRVEEYAGTAPTLAG